MANGYPMGMEKLRFGRFIVDSGSRLVIGLDKSVIAYALEIRASSISDLLILKGYSFYVSDKIFYS